MRIGVIGSAGGSAFEAACDIWRANAPERSADQFVVVTDRACGLEDIGRRYGFPVRRIEEPDNARFSQQATDYFQEAGGVDFVVLFYSRLVTVELFKSCVTYNIHPGLLPAFPGIGAVRKAQRHGVTFLGATLHRVDHTVDGGPIVAQACQPIRAVDPLAHLEKCSFLQKVYLTLLLFEMANAKEIPTAQRLAPEPNANRGVSDRFSPSLADRGLIDAFLKLQANECPAAEQPNASIRSGALP